MKIFFSILVLFCWSFGCSSQESFFDLHKLPRPKRAGTVEIYRKFVENGNKKVLLTHSKEEYDKRGNLIVNTFYFLNPEPKYTYYFVYNEHNHVIREYLYAETHSDSVFNKYEYRDGKIIKKIYGENYNVISYRYDSLGHLSERQIEVLNDAPAFSAIFGGFGVAEREYSYDAVECFTYHFDQKGKLKEVYKEVSSPDLQTSYFILRYDFRGPKGKAKPLITTVSQANEAQITDFVHSFWGRLKKEITFSAVTVLDITYYTKSSEKIINYDLRGRIRRITEKKHDPIIRGNSFETVWVIKYRNATYF
jgi:hypothetical protein